MRQPDVLNVKEIPLCNTMWQNWSFKCMTINSFTIPFWYQQQLCTHVFTVAVTHSQAVLYIYIYNSLINATNIYIKPSWWRKMNTWTYMSLENSYLTWTVNFYVYYVHLTLLWSVLQPSTESGVFWLYFWRALLLSTFIREWFGFVNTFAE